jgi:phage baseplate assembly protein W
MSDISINIQDKTSFVQGVEDVKQSWGIILSTIPGSIPLQPEFGSNLFQYIDQPVNKAFSEMANTIIKDLERWEKRAKIKRVQKTVDCSGKQPVVLLYIYGTFKPAEKDIIQKVEIVDNGNGGIGSMIIGSTFIIR